MERTDERHILNPYFNNEAEYYNHLMHIATYRFAQRYVKDKHVLDYGCGTGYGSLMLSDIAANVTAVDLSKDAIGFAKQNYIADNLNFKTIPELTDPHSSEASEKFDIVTSFQVIEHVPDDKEFVEKLKNLLNPGGYLLLSTPNKSIRLFNYIQRPWNAFHLKEYSYDNINNLLHKYFTKVEVLKIGSKSEFVKHEISRIKKQRLISLPCTLFFYPNFLRVFLLNLQVSIYKMITRSRKDNASLNKNTSIKEDFITKFIVEDIEVDKDVPFSTDLLAICLND
ncbi:MAG: methyltransferase domain-containing protein [Bacteroidales bacterium]|jgi:ubiquinone biosynthesis O-methyltransferase